MDSVYSLYSSFFEPIETFEAAFTCSLLEKGQKILYDVYLIKLRSYT
jgi:hypothetical protein